MRTTKQEEIMQEMAEFLMYYEDAENDWDELSDIEKFNYRSGARGLAVCLDLKGVVIKIGEDI